MITVIGIFENEHLADEASLYLMGNGFDGENVDVHTHAANTTEEDGIGDFFSHLFDDDIQAAHYATLARQGTVITVHALSPREAQEAVDVMNNYGAMDVNADGENFSITGTQSQIVDRVVDESKRLRRN
jgi:hypothetical protein